MKKIIIMTMIAAGFGYFTADAQTAKKDACGVNDGKVCRLSPDRKTASCYKTKYAENFKVCKGSNGYYICCEAPRYGNSTYAQQKYIIKQQQPETESYAMNENNDNSPVNNSTVNMTAPQSQSYVVTSSGTYQGYYPKRGRIKVCYIGDNVAENNRAPYEGCASPQYDGPEANRYRNMNVSNPAEMPPLSGRPNE